MSDKDKGPDKNDTRNADNEPAEQTDDTEGHNLFAMSDYYVNSKIGRHVDFEREARQNALAKEARAKKKPDRR